jgi:iron complex outermembrane recepter protein
MDSGIRADGRMETKRLPNLLRRCVLSLLLLTALVCAPTSWGADPKVKFDLRPDEFPKAILEFYHQSKVEVLFLSNDSLKKIRTQPVYGVFEPREALERMLIGTGLIFEFDTDHSVIIKQPQVVNVAPPQMLQPAPLRVPETGTRLGAASSSVLSDSEPPPEVLITGSLIHTAMDMTAPVQSLTYKDFSAAPFPTVQDAIYQLPISSLSTPREDLFLNNNYNWGSGIDLRGLGVAATLVLVNGHRQPLSGLNGDFVDVSNIPMAAVDRIEILPDGASALYGSDAIAGVVNIIMKDDFDGAETQVRYGGAPGGRDDVTASQLLGTHWGSGKAMLVYQYQNSTELSAAARGYAANADKRSYGGGDYRSYFTDPGNILDPNTLQPLYGIPGNLNGAPLTLSKLLPTDNLENQFAPFQIFPQRTSHSVYATGAQHAGDNIELFAEGRFTQRSTYVHNFPETGTLYVPAANPFNPFESDAVVGYNFGQSLGPITFGAQTRNYVGTIGARFKFGADWQASLSESYGRETLFNSGYNEFDLPALNAALASTDVRTAFNAFGGANTASTLAGISKDFIWRAISAIETTSLTADGPLFSLPAGPAKLAVGLERREESLVHTVGNIANPEETGNARYSRHVGSAFAELLVPIIGDAANPHAPPRLEINAAARYDDYSDFGHAVDPEFRLRFIPFEWLKLRGSWGRSFRAPKLDDLYDSSNNASASVVLPDPRSQTGQSTVLELQGDNPNLRQETAKTWTAGLDLVPTADPGLKLSLTYYSIDYEGQIISPVPTNPFDILVQENQWAAVITRNPTRAQIDAICNRPDYFGSRAACLASAPAAIVDTRLANLASTKLAGLDLDVRQSLDSKAGRFEFGFNGSYLFHFDQMVTDTSPSVDIVNTIQNPLKLRFRATAGWNENGAKGTGFGANLAANFTNGYSNPGSTLLRHIDSLTTLDVQFHYGAPNDAGAWSGWDFSLNAVNVFNQSPPFVDYIYGYDTSNFQALGRVLSLSVRKKW